MVFFFVFFVFVFFFQAEDGIRDIGVTGVQTCALPIYTDSPFIWCFLQPKGESVLKVPSLKHLEQK